MSSRPRPRRCGTRSRTRISSKPASRAARAWTRRATTHFEAKATLKIGPVKATFKGNVALERWIRRIAACCGRRPRRRRRLSPKAKPNLLTPEDGQTVLTYTAKASIGGKLAQIGQRLIDGAAKQIADDFFTRFAAAVSAATRSEARCRRKSVPGIGSVEAAGIAAPTAPNTARRITQGISTGNLGGRPDRRDRDPAALFRSGAVTRARVDASPRPGGSYAIRNWRTA